MNYHEREQQKAEAWQLLESAEESLETKARALLLVIDAHYWRAREHLEALPMAKQRRIHGKRYCSGYELSVDVYTRHWLHANGNRIAPEVMQAVREQWYYEPEASKFLEQGKTIYATSDTTSTRAQAGRALQE